MGNPKSDPRASKLLASINDVQSEWKGMVGVMKDANQAISEAGFPMFATGARAYITIAGMPYAIAQKVSYRITSSVEELRTVDTSFPWDLVVGQVRVQATIQGLIDPEQPAETDALWCNMASIIHQPLVDLEIFDNRGERMFISKGMFTSISVGLGMGAPGERSVEFLGITYAHNVNQKFVPYSAANFFSDAAKRLSSWSKGFF